MYDFYSAKLFFSTLSVVFPLFWLFILFIYFYCQRIETASGLEMQLHHIMVTRFPTQNITQ